MRTHSKAHYMRRFSLWLLGQALPETGALRKPARLALISVVVASAAGTLLALGVVGALVGLYLYLHGEGLSTGLSLTLVSGIGLMAGFITYLIAQSRLDRIPDTLDDLQLFRNGSTDIFGELASMVIGGFMEGVSERSESNAEKKLKQSREDIEDAIEALIARLDDLEDDTETVEEEVVLEIERHAPRARRRKPH